MEQRRLIWFMKEKIVTKFITDALFELLKTKELHEVTVTEVIKKSGVSRSTYYRNFYLLEDVLKAYVDSIFDRLPRGPLLSKTDIRRHSELTYTLCYEQRERLNLLVQRNQFHLLTEPMYQLCRDQVTALGIEDDCYRIASLSGSSLAIIREWILRGFAESPEEMAELCFTLINRR